MYLSGKQMSIELFRWLFVALLLIFGITVWYLRVPPVPTKKKEIDIALRMSEVGEGDLVFDLGCGDGQVLAAARRRGARIAGWEMNLPVWLLAKLRLGFGANVYLGDLWRAPVDTADVVFIFLMPPLLSRVEREIWAKMKKGSRLVSNAFRLPNLVPAKEESGVYLYIK